MAKPKYKLNSEERIVYKLSHVKYGTWGDSNDVLAITNQSIILEKYGVFNSFKGIERFDYSSISQVMQRQNSNGAELLELHIGKKKEKFTLATGNANEIKILFQAISDQMGSNGELYDSNYYTNFLEELNDNDRLFELRSKAQGGTFNNPGVAITGAAVKSILKSGDINVDKIMKGVNKTVKKQQHNNIMGDVVDKALDEFGVRDVQDCFIELGNDIREDLGLKTKITYAERKELALLEEKVQRRNLSNNTNNNFRNLVEQAKTRNASAKEQMELLQQLKNLLDTGVLTQSEFDQKKKEILDNDT